MIRKLDISTTKSPLCNNQESVNYKNGEKEGGRGKEIEGKAKLPINLPCSIHTHRANFNSSKTLVRRLTPSKRQKEIK